MFMPSERQDAAVTIVSKHDNDNYFSDNDNRDCAMWRAVITQSFMDATSGCKKSESRKAKREAIEWLKGSDQDFYTVCHFAGLNPDVVLEVAQKVLQAHAERGLTIRALIFGEKQVGYRF